MLYNASMEARYRNKIIAIIVLSVLIVCGLLYIHFMPSAPVAVKPQPTAEFSASPTTEASETPAPTPAPTPVPTPEPTATPDIITDDSLTRVVNRTLTVNADYVPSDLVDVNVHSAETKQLRKEAAESLEEMFQDAIDEQIYLKLVDGYRSYYYQLDLYNYYKSTQGSTYADSIDAYPGASEHQLGLAADLGCWNGACELNYCFTQYLDYQWLIDNSWKYGWIERYPDGKQSVTGIMYSPWHYRYVGKEAAKEIHDSGKTMEEFYNVPLQ